MQAFKHHESDSPSVPELPHHSGLQRATAAGERTLWIVFAIMAFSTVVFAIAAARQQAKNRIFSYITMFITMIAAISYYVMATGGGGSIVNAPGKHAAREIYWARYADWLGTTPLLLLDLALLAGLSGVDIVLISIADVGMIVTGVAAALDNGIKSRWGLYTFSCLFFLWVLYGLIITGRRTSKLRGDRVSSAYVGLSLYTVLLWTAYPVVWALAEGTNFLSVDQEILAYAILDVAAKAVFGAALLYSHAAIAEANVSLPSSWTEPAGSSNGYGAIRIEED